MAAGSPTSNVYTVLLFAAFVALVVAAVFLFFKSGELFPQQNGNPLQMPPAGVSLSDSVYPINYA